jgi:hypothetical protein
MTTSNHVTKHSNHGTKRSLNGASSAPAKGVRRAPSTGILVKAASSPMRIVGAAAAATGIAAGASVLLRKPLGKALRQTTRAAVSAGNRLGETTSRAGSNLLVAVGLRRRSFLSRMWPELGAVAGVLAAAGATTILWRGRHLETMIRQSPETPAGDHEEPRMDLASPQRQTAHDSDEARYARQ